MRAAASSQLSIGWLWKARLPSLLADLGYMSAISLAAVATFVIAGVFFALADPQHSALRMGR